MRIRYRLLLGLIPAILGLFVAVILLSFRHSETTVLEQINKEVYEIAHSNALEFDMLLETGRNTAEGISTAIELMPDLNDAAITALIRRTLEKNHSLYGCAVAMVPEKTPLGKYADYGYRGAHGFEKRSLSSDSYDYLAWDWFRDTVESGKAVWSEPYFDEGGGDTLMTTYSTPIRRNGEIIGVATIDISLNELVGRIKEMAIGRSGYAFLLSRGRRIIAHPDMKILSDKTINEMATERSDEFLKRLVKRAETPDLNSTELTDPFRNKPSWMISYRISSNGWTLVILFPTSEILAPLFTLKQQVLLVATVIMAGLVLFILWMASSVTSPIARLVTQTQQYAQGRFDQKLDASGGSKEIRDLSRAFNTMGDAIVEQMALVEETTAQKERYRQELVIAAEIQRGILPTVFPPFPELVDHVDLYGMVRPATEVGGDFYDFFRLPNGRIGFVIADVAGKGAPAAFFMATARILVREVAQKIESPSEVIRRANLVLEKDNPSAMFVTLLFGELTLNTGRIRCVCAGHNPPILRHVDGTVSEVAMPHNLPLGAMPGVYFEGVEFVLKPGECLVLYTDGITEAMNDQGKLYGTEPLLKAIAAENHSAEAMARVVDESVCAFCGNAPQADDITLLLVRRPEEAANSDEQLPQQPAPSIKLDLPATVETLEVLRNMIEAVGAGAGLSERDRFHVNLALEEIVANIVNHSYKQRTDQRMSVELQPVPEGLRVFVFDFGRPFDFDAGINQYDGQASLDQPIGGIGLYLINKFVSDVRYEPGTPSGNQISFIKRKT